MHGVYYLEGRERRSAVFTIPVPVSTEQGAERCAAGRVPAMGARDIWSIYLINIFNTI